MAPDRAAVVSLSYLGIGGDSLSFMVKTGSDRGVPRISGIPGDCPHAYAKPVRGR